MRTAKELEVKAKELWNSDLVPDEQNRSNQQRWIEAVLTLGEKWLLAKPVQPN
jgi:hypothetical protein